MPDLTSLQAALTRAKPEPTALVKPAAAPGKNPPPRCRQGRDHIGVWMPDGVRQSLKIVAAREKTTVQALLSAAIETLLRERGMPLP